MLSGPSDDCAVYTASFEESDLSNMYNNSITANRSSSSSPVDKTIWEGHGLMSWILDDKSQHEPYATGKLGPSSGPYKHTVEVILQLQPVCKKYTPPVWNQYPFKCNNAMEKKTCTDVLFLKITFYLLYMFMVISYAYLLSKRVLRCPKRPFTRTYQGIVDRPCRICDRHHHLMLD